MNPILAFGLFALLIIAGAAMVLYGLLQRPNKREQGDEGRTVMIDDRLKPIVLDFQEPGMPESEDVQSREPQSIIAQEEEDLPEGSAADAFSRLNERFRRMKELEAEEKRAQQGTEQEFQAGEANSAPREEPGEAKPDSNEKKTLPGEAEQRGA
jgi:hypothetical protein